jgi:hypothetical protein
MQRPAWLLIALGPVLTPACHTPAQADGNYYAGSHGLGRHGGAVWVARRMGLGGTPPHDRDATAAATASAAAAPEASPVVAARAGDGGTAADPP